MDTSINGGAEKMKVTVRTVRMILIVALGIFFSPHSVEAQKQTKVPRIGFLSPYSPSTSPHPLEAFQQGLHEVGYREGQNIAIAWRWAEGKFDRLSVLTSELIGLKVDVIVAETQRVADTAKQVTRTTPIVMAQSNDPVGRGLVASLARPGGNITGLTTITPELTGKRLELLKEVFPQLSRLVVLWNPTAPAATAAFNELEVAARSLEVRLLSLGVRGPNELRRAFSEIGKSGTDALMVLQDAMLHGQRGRIVDLAAKYHLPAMYYSRDYVEAGGLMGYGASLHDLFRRAAIYVDKILKGAKPSDLPVEQPTKFELVINLKTAKQIGLVVPPEVLMRANKVIR